jgi:hypothetical protein
VTLSDLPVEVLFQSADAPRLLLLCLVIQNPLEWCILINITILVQDASPAWPTKDKRTRVDTRVTSRACNARPNHLYLTSSSFNAREVMTPLYHSCEFPHTAGFSSKKDGHHNAQRGTPPYAPPLHQIWR